jgi:hypothetical protein
LERSDAGISIVQEVFGFVTRNLSEAQRRNDAALEGPNYFNQELELNPSRDKPDG